MLTTAAETNRPTLMKKEIRCVSLGAEKEEMRVEWWTHVSPIATEMSCSATENPDE